VRANGDLTLGWRVNLFTLDHGHWWDVTISAEFDEDVGKVIQITDWLWSASYQVFERPVQDPSFATPFGTRTIAVDPNDAQGGSPFGWHDANGVTGPEFLDTRGNNISAQDDLDNDDVGGTRPTSPTLDFANPLVLPAPPITHLNASITNVFYWGNLTHDVTFAHGFDEVSGNYQEVNYSGQGLGNDRVEADVQEGGLIGNAYFVPLPDGQEGRMAFGIFPVPLQPARDTALDGTIIAHEYGHGVSTRLTGGPANSNSLNATQSGAMGEGYGDWLALVMTAKPTDNPNTPRTMGDWVLNAPGVGIRSQPYSFDMSVDTHTLSDYNGDTIPGSNASEPHQAGEIWATVLWDLTQLLVQSHGFNNDLFDDTGGLQVALDIVLGGMKLQPANPTFIEARNAILAADLALYGGENFDYIWEAFARRGFGLSASAGIAPNLGPNSLAVVEAFDRPTPLARLTGTVFKDVNGNSRRDATDAPLQGWTVYADANNNAQLDVGEKSTVSGIDGSYSLSFFTSSSSVRIRQVVMPGFTQVLPANNAGYVVSVPGRGQVVSGLDFGNKEQPGKVSGIKWNDLDADAVLDLDDPLTLNIDEGEPGIKGVIIYADLNNDGRIGILEPAAITDFKGRYTLNIQPGTYTIRELNAPGYQQTFPDPLGATLGAHVGVIVTRGVITPDINFGNTVAVDWGDAPTAAQSGFPASYPTTLAQNGARHGILPGFGLGAATDGEGDGQPALNALGDDNTGVPDDEDGVVVPGLSPGQTINALVTVRNGGFSAGLLQGWIDWNRDGDWSDPGEQVVSNRLLRGQTAPHLVPIPVPPGTALGPTYARFRYGYESNLGPTGSASAGEVEDHLVVVLDVLPVAVPDCFGGGGTIPGCVPIIVKQGNAGTTLDVLANDFGTINGGPFLVQGDFPTFTTGGGVVNFSAGTLIYTPDPNFIGEDTFLYRIQDGAIPPNFSSPAPNTLVTIHVTASDPKAVDDTRTIQFVATPPAQPQRLPAPDLLANDFSPDPVNTKIVPGTLIRLTPGPAPVGELAQISADGKSIDFRPGTGFKGTVIYQYQIDDNDPLTSASTARVTIQVVDFVAGVPQPAPSHLAQLEIQYRDLAGNPIAGIPVDQDFIVRVTATDIAPNDVDGVGPFATRTGFGVATAYLDLLYDQTLASPVPSGFNPLDFFVVFDGKPGLPATGGTAVTSTKVTSTTAPTATSFSGGSQLDNNSDDQFNGLTVVFTSGLLVGQRARIIDYFGANNRLVFEAGSFTGPPAVGDDFTIERAFYDLAQTGAVNTPAPGSIDEIGGSHADPGSPDPIGRGPHTVFSARFHAGSVPGNFSALGDPAELNGPGPDSRVVLYNTPNGQPNEFIVLTDEQVFFKVPAPLTITDGNPEFSNLRNPFDVNDDLTVSPVDALTVINSLNVGGSRAVSQYSLAANGQLPSGFVDVNSDGYLAPLDALLVINYLNVGDAPNGEGESLPGPEEGEGESADLGSDAGATAALAFSVPENVAEGEVSEEDICVLPLPQSLHSIIGNLADDLQSLVHSSHNVDPDEVAGLVSDAVDKLLEELDCHDLHGFNPFDHLS
jgi:hypothetical protein